jgi:hypothetical protein
MQNPNRRAIKGTKKTPKLPNNFQKDFRANSIDAALAIKLYSLYFSWSPGPLYVQCFFLSIFY